ncbi:MAG TPA: sigma-70 family RNA polymerase sigma factor [Alphaproteobacteria bacterium]|nr:sigma-70 family RNA polymerase sigma factor [Alphaproteobacteria bacterium]
MNMQAKPSEAADEAKQMPAAEPSGSFDVRYAAFLETVAQQRVRLHRYCARMTGSVLDGEDVMQEALLQAYRKIDQLDRAEAVRPWLFRIAHNRCIDFLRSRTARERAEAVSAEDDIILPVDPAGAGPGRAIERLVVHLPPKERACVLLKDVFDHPLEEIADLVGSTVGGVKAALNRGRAKLAALPLATTAPARPADPALSQLLQRYVELSNRRDWDAVRALTSADAQLRVADCFKGLLRNSPYFAKYAEAEAPWRLAAGAIDGEPVVFVLHRHDSEWRASYPVRLGAADGLIARIADYYSCPWILQEARSLVVVHDRTEMHPE